VFLAGPAKFIFRSAQQVTPLIFVHHSIIALFRLLGASPLYHAASTQARPGHGSPRIWFHVSRRPNSLVPFGRVGHRDAAEETWGRGAAEGG
jgi:hypothetical protein